MDRLSSRVRTSFHSAPSFLFATILTLKLWRGRREAVEGKAAASRVRISLIGVYWWSYNGVPDYSRRCTDASAVVAAHGH